MDLADEAHKAQFERMEKETGRKIVKRWRWDATTDARVCTACTLLDGQEWTDEANVPARPHIGCRCNILPVTATELALRESGDSIRSRETITAVEFTNTPPPKQRKSETQAQYRRRMQDDGIFLTKKRGQSGEMQYRRRVVRQGEDVTDWLGSMAKAKTDKSAAALSLQEYFGGNRAGAQRARYFTVQVQQGANPRDALNNMLRQVGGNGNSSRWVPVTKLRQLNPAIEDAKPILSTRQRTAVAAGRNPGKPRRGY